MPRKKSYFIIIVGCGRLGGFLANRLSRGGHSIVVIDNKMAAFDKLSSDFSGFKIEGDATEAAVLENARVDKADALIAATREDNANLMIAQVARKVFGVSKVVARVFDPSREEIYQDLGIDTICPTTIATEEFIRYLADGEEQNEP
ncbi:MAG TPA: TrkA family potassium uptake protein [Candidatus Aminicenantes bacterium]|nr:TrkA family potassium uptake protein [Candidatus Aminicenantes bacterium]